MTVFNTWFLQSQKLLGANIETIHRGTKGDLIYKFVVKERKEGYL